MLKTELVSVRRPGLLVVILVTPACSWLIPAPHSAFSVAAAVGIRRPKTVNSFFLQPAAMRRQRRWRTAGAASCGAELSVDTRDSTSDILAELCTEGGQGGQPQVPSVCALGTFALSRAPACPIAPPWWGPGAGAALAPPAGCLISCPARLAGTEHVASQLYVHAIAGRRSRLPMSSPVAPKRPAEGCGPDPSNLCAGVSNDKGRAGEAAERSGMVLSG